MPHRLTFFALLIVTKGRGSHQIDLNHYSLKKGTVLKIAKGQVHAFVRDVSYDGILVVFTEEFVLRYFSQSSIEIISHLYNYHLSDPIVSHTAFVDQFLEMANDELSNKTMYAHKNILANILELFLLRLERHAHLRTFVDIRESHITRFGQFKNLVEKHFQETRNVKDYAKLMHISTRHLNNIVQKLTLNTAKHFIDQYVILEIKRNILSTNLSLKEIAFAVGFQEVTNFTKFFKKHTQSTPREYKKSL